MPVMTITIQISESDFDPIDDSGITEDVFLRVSNFAGQFEGLMDVVAEDD